MTSNWDGLLSDLIHANCCAGNRAPPRSRRMDFSPFGNPPRHLVVWMSHLGFWSWRHYTNSTTGGWSPPQSRSQPWAFLPFPPSSHGLRRSCPTPVLPRCWTPIRSCTKPWGFLLFIHLVFFCCFFGLSLPPANFPALTPRNIDLGQVLGLHMGQGSRQLEGSGGDCDGMGGYGCELLGFCTMRFWQKQQAWLWLVWLTLAFSCPALVCLYLEETTQNKKVAFLHLCRVMTWP